MGSSPCSYCGQRHRSERNSCSVCHKDACPDCIKANGWVFVWTQHGEHHRSDYGPYCPDHRADAEAFAAGIRKRQWHPADKVTIG